MCGDVMRVCGGVVGGRVAEVTQGKGRKGSSRHAQKTEGRQARGEGATRPHTPLPQPAHAGTISFESSSTRGGGWVARSAGGGWSLALLPCPLPKESQSSSFASPPSLPLTYRPGRGQSHAWLLEGGVVRWVGAVGGWVGGWACVRTREGGRARQKGTSDRRKKTTKGLAHSGGRASACLVVAGVAKGKHSRRVTLGLTCVGVWV